MHMAQLLVGLVTNSAQRSGTLQLDVFLPLCSFAELTLRLRNSMRSHDLESVQKL